MNFFDFGINTPLELAVKAEQQNLITKQAATDKEILARYRSLMESGETFPIVFSWCNEDGDMLKSDGDYKIVVYNHDENGHPLYNAHFANQRLLLRYEVKVVSIDEKAKLIVVTSNRLNTRETVVKKINSIINRQDDEVNKVYSFAKTLAKKKVEAAKQSSAHISTKTAENLYKTLVNEYVINGMKKKNLEFILTPAIVTNVQRDYLVCDILGLGIPARMSRYDWSYTYTGDLRKSVRVNDRIVVSVKSFNKHEREEREKGGRFKDGSIYKCTRLPALVNPWETFDYKKGDRIKIECKECQRKRWFGMAEGTDLEIFCEYPEGKGFDIIEGESYICIIYNVNLEFHNVKARVISQDTTKID